MLIGGCLQRKSLAGYLPITSFRLAHDEERRGIGPGFDEQFLEFADEERTHLDLLMREYRALRERQARKPARRGASRRTAKRR